MMKCLDDEELTRYINDEVSKDERMRFEGHLDSCQFCRYRLDENLESERMLGRYAADFPEGSADRYPTSPCKWPSPEHLLLYLKRVLPADDADKVEHHLQVCDACLEHLNLLARIERRSATTALQTVPENLVHIVQKAWQESSDRKRAEPKSEVVRLIIGLVERGLEVLRGSIIPSNLIITPVPAAIPAHAFRSSDEQATPDQIEALHFKKHSEGREVKVELTIQKKKDDRITLIVKLSKNADPLTNVRVSLLKDHDVLLESRKTELDGHAEFTILQPGSYLLRILSETIEWPIEIRKP